MKYLITGAAGFIASRTTELLLRQGHEVIGIDNLNEYYDVRLKHYRLSRIANENVANPEVREKLKSAYRSQSSISIPKFQAGAFSFELLDIENKPEVLDLFNRHKFDGVFNLAARAGVRYSMENPDIYMRTNAMGTLNLMDGMKKFGVKKLVLASTSSLYAGQEMPFTEKLAVNTPISPYAASKKAAEMLAHSYSYLYEIDVSIVRYFTVFGPCGRPDMCIFRFIKWIDEGTPIELFGDGSQSRDFTFVDDIAKGTIAALKLVSYEVFNLGGGKNPISLDEIISWIEESLGKQASRLKKPFHKADIKETWADISKADRILDWSPKTEVRDGVEQCIQWYLANRSWLNSVKL
ncbi:NAD-dependent epimerase/dehydratase family protein [Pelagicoccus sp. SDUM812002]|uniref:NAD-dependent epimerase/dehydratase family protein n=1 Tax=Pelagicoccus sp. SDUM812002 TaxID=3041266 RepID=UPI00280C4A90|nr:NAD-dependent epimerase/dehydratase family protein [Pelagicoccus sp. SDUM812002]MDQ8186295.1 NAD-dependent epimerase/dehydratase family protein [Pelagicoccus sp. SDUM812002]